MHLSIRTFIGLGAGLGTMAFVLAAVVMTPQPAEPSMQASQTPDDCPPPLKAKEKVRTVSGA